MLEFRLKTEVELVEFQCDADLTKEGTIPKIEADFSEQIRQHLLETYRSLSKRYRADLFELTDRLKNRPALNRWIRDDPRSFFERAEADVKVSLKFRNIGNSVKPLNENGGSS